MIWRGTWGLTLLPQLRQAWEAVALKHGGSGYCYVEGLLSVQVKRHGDAVFYIRAEQRNSFGQGLVSDCTYHLK